MATFGFYPGPIDYWMLITDWRNGSIAIMLAIGGLIIGYAFRTGSPVTPPPTDGLPTHASPAIAEGEIEEGDAGTNASRPRCAEDGRLKAAGCVLAQPFDAVAFAAGLGRASSRRISSPASAPDSIRPTCVGGTDAISLALSS
jgi:hypothetical protein